MIKTIRIDVSFIAEGESKKVIRILDGTASTEPMPSIAEFKRELDEWLNTRFDFDVTIPGISA